MYDSHRTYSRQGEDKEKTQGGGGGEGGRRDQKRSREKIGSRVGERRC